MRIKEQETRLTLQEHDDDDDDDDEQHCSAYTVNRVRPRMMNYEAHLEHIGRRISIVHKIFIGKT